MWYLCSSERPEDAGKTTVDLEQDAVNVETWFDKDILKTIKVTIHQHTPIEETHRDKQEEEEEVCGGAFKLRFRDQFIYNQFVECSLRVHNTYVFANQDSVRTHSK